MNILCVLSILGKASAMQLTTYCRQYMDLDGTDSAASLSEPDLASVDQPAVSAARTPQDATADSDDFETVLPVTSASKKRKLSLGTLCPHQI
mgnify:CR=1 FL=1